MADFDREKLSQILEELGVTEEFYAKELVSMAMSKGLNKSVALRMIGDIKGLGKKSENREVSMLEALGVGHLNNTVQLNKKRITGAEVVEFTEVFSED
jgi:hypothetical protein